VQVSQPFTPEFVEGVRHMRGMELARLDEGTQNAFPSHSIH
jgi:hypothetical protein